MRLVFRGVSGVEHSCEGGRKRASQSSARRAQGRVMEIP